MGANAHSTLSTTTLETKGTQVIVGNNQTERIPHVIGLNIKPDGWLFDTGDASSPMVIFNESAAQIVERENPTYRSRPFIFVTELPVPGEDE